MWVVVGNFGQLVDCLSPHLKHGTKPVGVTFSTAYKTFLVVSTPGYLYFESKFIKILLCDSFVFYSTDAVRSLCLQVVTVVRAVFRQKIKVLSIVLSLAYSSCIIYKP